MLEKSLLVEVEQLDSLFANDLGPEQSVLPAEDHFFEAELAPVRDFAHNLLDQDVGCAPTHLFLGQWISACVAHLEEEFHLHLALLDEVYCVRWVAQVEDFLARLKRHLLEVLAHPDDLHQRPVSDNWHLLEEGLAESLSVHIVDLFAHMVALLGNH